MKLNPTKCSFRVTSGKFLGYLVTKKGIEADPTQIKVVENIQSQKGVKDVQKLTGRLAALHIFISKYSVKSHLFFSTLRKCKGFVWSNDCEEALSELKRYLSSPPLLSKPCQVNVYLFIYPFPLTL